MSGDPDAALWRGRQVAVTGGGGFLGRPVVAMLEELGAEVRAIRSADHDLRERAACDEALRGANTVMHLAADVGGIGYNRRNPGPLAHDNMAMGLNVFEASRELGIEKLVAACSVCAYPLHPPGRPDQLRDAHLPAIAAPVLIVQGSRDTFGTPAELAPVLARMTAPVTLTFGKTLSAT